MSAADDAYDRGITALAQKDYPTAIANLLAARAQAPRDSEIGGALADARSRAETTAHLDEPLPIVATDVAAVWLVANLGLAVVIAKRRRGRLLVAVLASWGLCAAGWLGLRIAQPVYAVTARPEVVAHVADDAESLERFRLRAGDELIVEERRGDWLKVRSPSGERAYVSANDLLSVETDGQR